MKSSLVLTAVVVLASFADVSVWDWGEYERRFVENSTWGPGERLVFSVEYGIIKAGTATLSVTGPVEHEGLLGYRITAEAASNPAFSSFFEVRDVNESLLDIVQLHSLTYMKSLNEGEYSNSEEMYFDQEEGYAYYPEEDDPEEAVVPIPPHALDVLSAFYYARTMEMEPGNNFSIDVHVDNDNYPLEVQVLERGSIRTRAGTFDCIQLHPVLRGEGLFKQQGEIFIWVTDDERHIPVLMSASIVIGEITCILEEFTLGTPLEVENPFI
ncbi:hypothetical protein CSA37_03960 [Candidatus Fermentibacteria bacterium]|nr:MAG: hypothetical protein CSA37_10755 [Candidatus Fermentibacteria bacterium]PIE52807.1 MAG: hypothetical protein CSA37_03960 [Candidatus Fermentibacteria bacterium]